MRIIHIFNEIESNIIAAAVSESNVGYHSTTNITVGQLIQVYSKGYHSTTDIIIQIDGRKIHCPMYNRFRQSYTNERKR